jgi:hypothetical protein
VPSIAYTPHNGHKSAQRDSFFFFFFFFFYLPFACAAQDSDAANKGSLSSSRSPLSMRVLNEKEEESFVAPLRKRATRKCAWVELGVKPLKV